MKNNKYFLASIVGAVVFFILGWIVYGMILKDFMANHAGSATGVMKTDEEMGFGSLILGQLASGFLYATILMWAGANSMMSGAKIGAIVGILMSASMDFTFLGTSNIMTLTGIIGDIIAWTVISIIAGAVIGMVMGSGQKAAAA